MGTRHVEHILFLELERVLQQNSMTVGPLFPSSLEILRGTTIFTSVDLHSIYNLICICEGTNPSPPPHLPKPQCNLHPGCAGIIRLIVTWMSSIQTSGLMLAYQKMKSLSQENRLIVVLNQEGWAKTL